MRLKILAFFRHFFSPDAHFRMKRNVFAFRSYLWLGLSCAKNILGRASLGRHYIALHLQIFRAGNDFVAPMHDPVMTFHNCAAEVDENEMNDGLIPLPKDTGWRLNRVFLRLHLQGWVEFNFWFRFPVYYRIGREGKKQRKMRTPPTMYRADRMLIRVLILFISSRSRPDKLELPHMTASSFEVTYSVPLLGFSLGESSSISWVVFINRKYHAMVLRAQGEGLWPGDIRVFNSRLDWNSLRNSS